MTTKLLTQKEAAEILRILPETLCVWRATKRYPLNYVKVGSKVFYRQADIESFISNRTKSMEGTQCIN